MGNQAKVSSTVPIVLLATLAAAAFASNARSLSFNSTIRLASISPREIASALALNRAEAVCIPSAGKVETGATITGEE